MLRARGCSASLLQAALRPVAARLFADAPAVVQPIKVALEHQGEVGTVSGAPHTVLNRTAFISSAARTACQQGMARTLEGGGKWPAWRIDFDVHEKWQNPLIGWTSTADPLENVSRASLAFEAKEDAIAFCIKHGWKYEVAEPHMRRKDRMKRFAGYGDNFSVKRGGYPVGGLPSELAETKKAGKKK